MNIEKSFHRRLQDVERLLNPPPSPPFFIFTTGADGQINGVTALLMDGSAKQLSGAEAQALYESTLAGTDEANVMVFDGPNAWSATIAELRDRGGDPLAGIPPDQRYILPTE
jgi:hypothetical protein